MDIVEVVLAAHSLPGCDTVASCIGIGKGTAIKVLRGGKPLICLGDSDALFEVVVANKQLPIKNFWLKYCGNERNCS